jgi:hypothetical protein
MTTVFFTTVTDLDTGNEDTFINQTLVGAARTVIDHLFEEWTIEVTDQTATQEMIEAAFDNPSKTTYDGGMRSVSMKIDVRQYDADGHMYPHPQLGIKVEMVERTLHE